VGEKSHKIESIICRRLLELSAGSIFQGDRFRILTAMVENTAFAFLRPEAPPATEWSLQPSDLDHFDPFTSNRLSADFPHPPQTELECPIPNIPICESLEPSSVSVPRRSKPTTGPNSLSGPEWFRWAAIIQMRCPGQSRRSETPVTRSVSDVDFEKKCSDGTAVFNPHKIGFIPSEFWSDKSFTFGQLVKEFFQRKNRSNCRFSHKLYNALKIVGEDPSFSEWTGIGWVTDKVLRIDKMAFARLLAIKTVDGSLFHQQGNFPSHGFLELTEETASQFVPKDVLRSVDFDNVRLLVHQPGLFTRGCTEEEIEQCKWISSRKRNVPAGEGGE
jgi:hypothetical protein